MRNNIIFLTWNYAFDGEYIWTKINYVMTYPLTQASSKVFTSIEHQHFNTSKHILEKIISCCAIHAFGVLHIFPIFTAVKKRY